MNVAVPVSGTALIVYLCQWPSDNAENPHKHMLLNNTFKAAQL